jgi:peptidoglycan hydrolase-like protein with peptidoglycan-binding domain
VNIHRIGAAHYRAASMRRADNALVVDAGFRTNSAGRRPKSFTELVKRASIMQTMEFSNAAATFASRRSPTASANRGGPGAAPVAMTTTHGLEGAASGFAAMRSRDDGRGSNHGLHDHLVVPESVTYTSERPTLQRGMWLPEVEDLQRLIGIDADGLFDGRTEMALRERQRALDLVPDGICGPKTWAALLG